MIGFVTGRGTTHILRSCSFSDAQSPAASPVISYRSRQIDRDGAVDYSAVVAVAPATPKAFGLRHANPNPFDPFTVISFSLPEGRRLTLLIVDKTGRVVARLADHEGMAAGSHTMMFSAAGLARQAVISLAVFRRREYRAQDFPAQVVRRRLKNSQTAFN